jgi:hypothetical protein
VRAVERRGAQRSARPTLNSGNRLPGGIAPRAFLIIRADRSDAHPDFGAAVEAVQRGGGFVAHAFQQPARRRKGS